MAFGWSLNTILPSDFFLEFSAYIKVNLGLVIDYDLIISFLALSVFFS